MISTRFIGHAKMCYSDPQEWPAPMVSYFNKYYSFEVIEFVI